MVKGVFDFVFGLKSKMFEKSVALSPNLWLFLPSSTQRRQNNLFKCPLLSPWIDVRLAKGDWFWMKIELLLKTPGRKPNSKSSPVIQSGTWQSGEKQKTGSYDSPCPTYVRPAQNRGKYHCNNINSPSHWHLGFSVMTELEVRIGFIWSRHTQKWRYTCGGTSTCFFRELCVGAGIGLQIQPLRYSMELLCTALL